MTNANKIWRYRIAGYPVESNIPLADLPPAPLTCETAAATRQPRPDRSAVDAVWCGKEIDTAIHDFKVSLCFATAETMDIISMGESRAVLINHSDHRITVNLTDVDPAVIQHLLLGPALGLWLARQDMWLVHASSIFLPATTVLFCGHSGAGKSTLAQHLESSLAGCVRVADDISVIHYGDDRPPLLIPDFPQPRLRADQQPGGEITPRRAGQICVLSGSTGDTVKLTRMNEVSACVAIANHMLTSTIPIPWVQKKLLHRAAKIASSCQVNSLRYAHAPRAIGQVGECLDRLLAGDS